MEFMDNKQKKKPKLRYIIGATVLSVILALFIVNQLTPWPFDMMFRAFNSQNKNAITLGPYENDIAQVVAQEPISIPVTGYPDATITIYDIPNNQTKPLVFFIHGGGWILGDSTQLESLGKLIASRGYVVASLDYSLAPEHTYPTPVHQALEALSYLNLNANTYNIDTENIFIGGNSAGAQLSSQIASITTQTNLQELFPVTSYIEPSQIKGLLLLNGVYNFDSVGKAGFPGFGMFAWSYTGKKQYTSYERIRELSTVYHVTNQYPPTFITAGDADPLEAQSFEFELKLRENNVPVTSVYWTGSHENLNHDYFFDLSRKPSQEMFETMMTFMQQNVTQPIKN
ncbi:alpha/beta hydrolase [Erysipelothrix sp. HDW6B]|uniref:alpha/beta hydrolase n=1 Tax=Erysipelothrix sp. HDW6B TaxID=2714929 RepID=UPI001408038F|nr:alpha/beta hydrolase [Erysipelothrix sp. HDW6B]QIK85507.1 alpha/beta hydrolase [Erysipelothrix sp. HDW6B]